MELMDDLNTCLDENYFGSKFLEELKDEGYKINKMLNGFISYLKKRKSGATNQSINNSSESTNHQIKQ